MKLATPHPVRHPNPTAKACELAYLIFERPDIAKAEAFLADFGLMVASREEDTSFLRGNGPAACCYVIRKAETARFAGFGLIVETEEELKALAALPDAGPIDLSPWPGGGQRLQLTCPSGFEVHVVFGREKVEPLPHRAPFRQNSADSVARINESQRVKVAPPEVIKLGHLVVEVADYQKTADWYTRHFGFIPTDVQVFKDGSPAVAFLRVDRGDIPVDHHTLVLAQGVVPRYSHTAFELIDTDAVAMGQRVMRERQWHHAWGMGRHLLGSQIFDYWSDPWGCHHEHYCDGDLYTVDMATGIHPVSRQAMSQWGPELPRSFTKPKVTLAFLRGVLHSLRTSPDLTISKLRTLMKLFG
jgi:catechol 2,3-dioxygenase-like lactoylglutathione lyase family enzyme